MTQKLVWIQVTAVALMAITVNTKFIRAQSPASASVEEEDRLALMHIVDQLQPYRVKKQLQGQAILSGSRTMADLGHQWRVNFQQFHPQVEFSGSAENSEAGLKALAQNPAVIAGVSRNVDRDDIAMLQAGKCRDPLPVVVGFEAMAIVVHVSNPIESITPQQIQQIFAANPDGSPVLETWGQLDVKGSFASQKIERLEREPGSGTQAFIQRTLLGGSKMAPSKAVAKSNLEVVEIVAKQPNGVGLTSFSCRSKDVRFLPINIQGEMIDASDHGVLSGKYPLMRPLVLVIDKNQLNSDGGLREAILEYVLSRDGQLEVMKAGFYPLNPNYIRQQLASINGVQLR